jgi:RimJ/RimL family protein N-acetyltransferase
MASLPDLEIAGQDIAHVKKNFDRRGTLWCAYVGDSLAGSMWTFLGGFRGFYSVPVHCDESIIVSVHVSDAFRGRGIWPMMLSEVCRALHNDGVHRVYIKVHRYNKPMLRSMSKTNAERLYFVRTIDLFGKAMTIFS